jgi:hypothetical protein
MTALSVLLLCDAVPLNLHFDTTGKLNAEQAHCSGSTDYTKFQTLFGSYPEND